MVKLTEEIRQLMNMPRRYWAADYNKIPDGLSYKHRINDYMVNGRENIANGVGIYFSGPYGSGKSSAAAIVGKEVRKIGKTVHFVTFAELKKRLATSEEWREGVSYEDRFEAVDLLIIDDLGREHMGSSGFVESTLDTLVRARYNDCKPTIITSNISTKDFSSRYGESLVSILHESMRIISVKGKNWREEDTDGN